MKDLFAMHSWFTRMFSLILAALGLGVVVFKASDPTPVPLSNPGLHATRTGISPTLLSWIDVHAHLDPEDREGAIRAALQAITAENQGKIVFMPPPFNGTDSGRYDAELILPHLQGYKNKLASLGGGGSLNVMIQESVISGDAGPEIRRRFKEKAEELLRAGAAGFGEMAAEHFQGATAYQSAPPDHPLFLLLADIAAEHGVPIDLHMEAVPQPMPLPSDQRSGPNPPQLPANIAALERLLDHNRRARIIWAHAGADNTGYRTPQLCRRLLQSHPNLYMELKIDPAKLGKNFLLEGGTGGKIRPEWLQLLQEFPDRFLAGSDQHYPEPVAALQRRQAVMLLLNQLPPELQRKIAAENALRLYPTPGGNP
jgi:predicted TIM-barrel fold metal-dependent hydrolase